MGSLSLQKIISSFDLLGVIKNNDLKVVLTYKIFTFELGFPWGHLEEKF